MIKGATRTIKDALGYNLSQVVDASQGDALAPPSVFPTNGLMTLIVKYAAACQRLYSQGPDGRTPHERSTGRRHNPARAEFGESVWWMPLQTSSQKLPPLGARFEEGFYIGANDGSAENLILTPTGIVKCRTIRRKPPRER